MGRIQEGLRGPDLPCLNLQSKKLFEKCVLGPISTWRTFTGVKLNNNCNQCFRPAVFWPYNPSLEPELH